MKLLIASDIHGALPAAERVVQLFEQHRCDLLCLLGDLLNYGPRNGVPQGLDAPGIAALLNRHAGHIIAVRGNCDSEVDQMLLRFPIMADYALIADGTRRIFLTGISTTKKRCPRSKASTTSFTAIRICRTLCLLPTAGRSSATRVHPLSRKGETNRRLRSMRTARFHC